MTMDDAWSPSFVEPQLVANKFIELGVWFDTFVRHYLCPAVASY